MSMTPASTPPYTQCKKLESPSTLRNASSAEGASQSYSNCCIMLTVILLPTVTIFLTVAPQQWPWEHSHWHTTSIGTLHDTSYYMDMWISPVIVCDGFSRMMITLTAEDYFTGGHHSVDSTQIVGGLFVANKTVAQVSIHFSSPLSHCHQDKGRSHQNDSFSPAQPEHH